MKRIVLKTILGVVVMIALMAVSGCRDIFHSKEDIDYVDLAINKQHSSSVKIGNKNYCKFHAEQEVTYYISWYVSNWSYTVENNLKVTTFWYDTGGTITGEQSDWRTKDYGPSFTASRSGDVVVKITAEKAGYGSSPNTADYNFMISTRKDNFAWY